MRLIIDEAPLITMVQKVEKVGKIGMEKFNSLIKNRKDKGEMKIEGGLRNKKYGKKNLSLIKSKLKNQVYSVNFEILKKLNISSELFPHKHVYCNSNCEFSTRFIPGDQCSNIMFKVKDN